MCGLDKKLTRTPQTSNKINGLQYEINKYRQLDF